MKKYLFFFLMIIASCQSGSEEKQTNTEAEVIGSLAPVVDSAANAHSIDTARHATLPVSNDRFKDVTIQKFMDSVKVKGEARIFEATLSYAVYNEGKQVLEGFQTTSAGAPEWGKFEFNIAIPTSSGHPGTYVILFESSAKDGSRIGELIFPL